jgi:hypothetical protein
MLQCSMARRSSLAPALQDFDRAFKRAQLAVGEALELVPERSAGGDAHIQAFATLLREPEREATAIVGILGALDQAGSDQRIDRAADRRSAAPERLGDIIESRRFLRRDRLEKFLPGALHALAWALRDPLMSDRGEPRGNRIG